MKENKEKRAAVSSASGGTPIISNDASKEAFTRRLTMKLDERFKRHGAKLTEPRPVSSKGI